MAAKKTPVKKTHRYECKPIDGNASTFTFVGLDGTEVKVPRLAFIPASYLTNLDVENAAEMQTLLTDIAGEKTADYIASLPLVYMQQFFEAWNADSEDLLGK